MSATDGDHRAPLREARAEAAVLDETLAQAVETVGDELAVGDFGELAAPLSTLMPGMMPSVSRIFDERAAVGRVLADRLVEEDHAADVVGRARRW